MKLDSTIKCYSEQEVGALDHPEVGFVTQLRDKVTMYINQDTGEIQPPDAKGGKVKPFKVEKAKKKKEPKPQLNASDASKEEE